MWKPYFFEIHFSIFFQIVGQKNKSKKKKKYNGTKLGFLWGETAAALFKRAQEANHTNAKVLVLIQGKNATPERKEVPQQRAVRFKPIHAFRRQHLVARAFVKS